MGELNQIDRDLLIRLDARLASIDKQVSYLQGRMDKLMWAVLSWSASISAAVAIAGVGFQKFF